MYITKSEFEAYLWIQFEEEDTTPDILIGWVESAVNSYIGAENWILKQEYEEKIDVRSLILNEDWYNIYLKYKPIDTEADITINGVKLDENTPYMLVRWRQLVVKNLEAIKEETSPFTTRNRIKVGYTAWYEEVPKDIKTVCLFLCSVIWLTRNFRGMTNYRLWDESISIWTQRYIYDSPIVRETLAKYRKIYIAY